MSKHRDINTLMKQANAQAGVSRHLVRDLSDLIVLMRAHPTCSEMAAVLLTCGDSAAEVIERMEFTRTSFDTLTSYWINLIRIDAFQKELIRKTRNAT